MNEKIKVLVADDNREFASTLISYLSKEDDMEVVEVARDGNEAFEKIINTKPDIVLLDVIMPHLDGLGVLEKINDTEMEKKPMCIILSAVGVKLKEQPKCVWLSYVITVAAAWFSALLIFFLLEGVMGSADGLSTIVYVSAMVLGFPGFAFLMAISEFGTSSAEALSTILYFLCGLIPVIVTFVSVKIKRTFDSE